MDWEAVLIIGALALALGIVCLVPGLLWARWRNRRNPSTPAARAVSIADVSLASGVVIYFLAGLTAPLWAPDSAFGLWMSNDSGRLTFVGVSGAVLFAVERALRSILGLLVAPESKHDDV